MSRKILGYPLTADWRANKPQELELPICGASILSVELVDGNFVLYVEHDPVDESPKMRKLVLFKAGQNVDSYTKDYTFIGTMVNGPWAWHVYIGLDCEKEIANEVIYEIRYTLKDGSKDSITLRADTHQRLRELASLHLAKVGGTDPWSRKIQVEGMDPWSKKIQDDEDQNS